MKSVHIMLDLETLAIDPKAAIIQIGAVAYDNEASLTGLAKKFSVCVDGSLPAFSVDNNTLKWHMENNVSNYLNIRSSAVPLTQGLIAFHAWVKAFEQPKKIWANGTDFDIPIINNAFKHFNLFAPWAYNGVRDFRTVKELFKEQIPYTTKGNHDALKDAEGQMEHLLKLVEAGLITLE